MSQNLTPAPGYERFKFKNMPKETLNKLENSEINSFLNQPLPTKFLEQELVNIVLGYLKKQGADYGDLRLGRNADRVISTLGTNITTNNLTESCGIGIRALVNGYWGFAATCDLTPQGVEACAHKAVNLAKHTSQALPESNRFNLNLFAEEPAHVAIFHTPIGICPFTTPASIAVNSFINAAEIAVNLEGIKRVYGILEATGFRRVFASTEGAYIESSHCVVNAELTVTAVSHGTSATRSLVSPGMAGGLEHFWNEEFAEKIKATCFDALSKCSAQKPAPGKYDLILDGHNLALTMHESVGHPTELDRILGYEMSMAGGSFATIDKLNNFKYGSSIVNFTANNKLLYGAASRGYDDEGVECQSFPIIQEGLLVGFGNNRETAHLMGAKRANGTCRSTSWFDTPIVRIPNLYLEPSKEQLSLKNLISNTKNGILIQGRGSFSIDQMRYNFQFGGDMCYRIVNGHLADPLRDVIYQSITPEFWANCDAICDASEWQMHGIYNCGKGHPGQTARMMHGAAPARFRNISVGY